ncbi:hypothetical protein J7E25_05880 [Agromyces sp. ISL-38]|uniref:hypothetical protein n=1 Tax=Agromyces sp. ISL-38 TaxID=2819107 RepID=UPI001BECE7C3|nr:hypothetical protein [Agromyces sp. ISL-38]MBT2498618.1 hypothetical protein [Agromyces sp. ISL-38]
MLTVTGCNPAAPGDVTAPRGQSPDTALPTETSGTEGGGAEGGGTEGGGTEGGGTEGGGGEGGNEEPTENPNVVILGPVISLNFGTEIGDFDTDTRPLVNGSDSDVTLGTAEIANENASNPFTFEDLSTTTTLCGGVLPAHAQCSITIRFTPTEIGVQLATLTVRFPADNTIATATYRGTGKAATVRDLPNDMFPTDQAPVKAPAGTQAPAP